MVSDTLIIARHGRFQCAQGGVSTVARLADQGYVWFVPKVAPSKHWLAKILVEVLVSHDLADIGKKNELELARVHWHAQKNGNHPNKDQSLGHDQNFGQVHFGHNPNAPQHPARRGCTGRRDAFAEWCSTANCILRTCDHAGSSCFFNDMCRSHVSKGYLQRCHGHS